MPRPKKKKKKAHQPHPAFRPVAQDARWLAAQQRRPGFLLADVSGGVERRQIPVFNEVDDEPAPADLTYVRDSVVGSAAAQALVGAGRRALPDRWCGKERGRASGPLTAFTRDGSLRTTESLGVWECCDACLGATCQSQRLISTRGLFLPLELFRTPAKGWGVRCAVDIPAGAFICAYEGELITSSEAVRCIQLGLASAHLRGCACSLESGWCPPAPVAAFS